MSQDQSKKPKIKLAPKSKLKLKPKTSEPSSANPKTPIKLKNPSHQISDTSSEGSTGSLSFRKKSRDTYANTRDVSYYLEDNLVETLTTHLESELVSKITPANSHELEFRVGSYDGTKFDAFLDRLTFNRMIQHYHDKYRESGMEESISLDVVHNQNFRVTINGQTLNNSKSEIEYFCKTNRVRPASLSFLDKVQIKRTDNQDWSYRLSSARESPITSEMEQTKIIQAVESKTVSKFYRYKHRYSYFIPERQVRVDFTILKETPSGNLAGTLVTSRTLAQKEKYQVEMEYIGTSFQMDHLRQQLLSPLTELLKTYQGTKGSPVPVSLSYRNLVITRYLETALGERITVQEINQKPTTTKFLAMDVEALTRENFSLILKDYLVTAKADGEHYLLYINPDLGVILINNRLQVNLVKLGEVNPLTSSLDGIPASASSANDLFSAVGEAIYDGELVESEGRFTFLVFDCFFFRGEDKRNLPLFAQDKGRYVSTPNSRIHYVKELMKRIINQVLTNELSIEEKRYDTIDKVGKYFRRGSDNQQIMGGTDAFKYNMDGLIYMNVTSPYPKIVKQGGRLIKKGSLDNSDKIPPILKWKPPQFLSVDFRVNTDLSISRDPSSFRSSQTPTGQVTTENNLVKINGEEFQVFTLESAYGSQIRAFEPSCYRVKDYNRVYIKLTKGQPILTDPPANFPGYHVDQETKGHVIRNKDILEFVWLPDRSFGSDFWGRWFPIKYREDKTQNGFPNGYRKVADRTWMAIHDRQILPENLQDPFGKTFPSPQLNMGYYQSQTRDSLPHLRNIHNSIKSVLIFLAINQAGSNNRRLFDLATGRGGDLLKWTGINYAFGLEFDEGNLKAGDASAFSRYRKMIESSRVNNQNMPFTMDLVQGDMRSLLTNHQTSDEPIFNYIIKEKLLNRRESFGVISCQFALHYACGTDQHLENFLQNISANLSNNGFFVATFLDGAKVLNALKSSDEPYLEGKVKNTKMWSIRAPSRYTKLETTGQRIMVFNKTIKEDEETEFLVNTEHLIKVAEKFDLVPSRLTHSKYNIPSASYGFGSFTEAYQEDFLKLIGETVYSKGSPRFTDLTKSFDQIPPDIRRYSQYSGFLVLRKTLS